MSMEVLADRTRSQASLTQICGPHFNRSKHKSLWEDGTGRERTGVKWTWTQGELGAHTPLKEAAILSIMRTSTQERGPGVARSP